MDGEVAVGGIDGTALKKVPNGKDMDVWRMVMLCQNVVKKWAKCECVKFQIINI